MTSSRRSLRRAALAAAASLSAAGCMESVKLGPDAVAGQTPDAYVTMHEVQVAYIGSGNEWTSTPDNRNMHRNVFFKDCAKDPEMPFSSLESTNPTDLWSWMDEQRKSGNELLAISHNANLSDGHMFPIDVDEKGRPIDAAWAASRDRNERLTEIKQIKGQSETHPLLSPNDEFASYELFNYLLGNPAGRIPTIPGSFVRQALKDGIALQETRGFNPYKTGVVGGSDSHNTAVPYRQTNFFGAHGVNDGNIKERMSGHVFAGLDVRLESPAGLTGLWAEENTRVSLFEAMQRKETFATSGPRIPVRFFGGWKFAADTTEQADWVATGYSDGVPMGGDLPPVAGKAPSCLVGAMKDPTSGNLDRIQIVKGWARSGQSFEKIFDVAWAGERKPDRDGAIPPIGCTVDVAAATYTNDVGAVELKATWTDPEFDPRVDAHLVHADPRGAENGQGGADGRRAREEGRRRARRRRAEGPDRRQDGVGPEPRSATRRSRWRSTSSATSTTARAATSSAS